MRLLKRRTAVMNLTLIVILAVVVPALYTTLIFNKPTTTRCAAAHGPVRGRHRYRRPRLDLDFRESD